MTTEAERWKGLCRKVAGALNRRSAEYEESQRELAFARNELACKCAEIDGLEWQVEELEGDNAKLRELVREIWSTCPSNEDDCKKCPHHTGESVEDWCDFPIRLHELGIEVEG